MEMTICGIKGDYYIGVAEHATFVLHSRDARGDHKIGDLVKVMRIYEPLGQHETAQIAKSYKINGLYYPAVRELK